MNILGISCYYHDSASALVKDGEIIAAAEEERFTRKKHDSSFPKNSIRYCLKEGNINTDNIDYVVFYEKPFIKFERILYTHLHFVPKGIPSFLESIPLWLKQKIFLKENISKGLNYNGKILFSKHHLSHAASAFYPSPFKEAAILTLDAVGEWSTTSFGIGKGNNITLSNEINFPHSLGLFYSAFTYYLGFKVNSGEYKVMGLAPYGKPKYTDKILNNLIDVKNDGSFRLNMKYFNYCTGLTMTNKKFHNLFKGLPRKPNSPLTTRHMDIASSLQKVTEKIILQIVYHTYTKTGQKNLCLAGGVGLNCVVNGKILKESPFKNLWIQPAATDAGGSLGSALLVWYKYLENNREPKNKKDYQKSTLLGPSFNEKEISDFLNENKIPYKKFSYEKIPKIGANIIANKNILGWFQGRMEFGPRALGSRSILADPRLPEMQSIINQKVKFRESFRPFAPSVLLEKTSDFFDIYSKSPYMILVAPVKEDKRIYNKKNNKLKGLNKVKEKRSVIPSVTHVNYTARLHTVEKRDNSLYYNLIQAFYKKTGCPIMLNTSFNVRGEPIVCTPQDAYKCFLKTEMDYLIIGKYIINKKELKNGYK